jgi:hypothetical protein
MNLSSLNAHYERQKMINAPLSHQRTAGVAPYHDNTIQNGYNIPLRSLDDAQVDSEVRQGEANAGSWLGILLNRESVRWEKALGVWEVG